MAKEIRRMDILFRDPSATYRAGECVLGNVVLDLGGELKVKSIRLQLYGIARVSWDENKSYTKGTSSKTSHKNVDVYLDETIMLVSRTDTLRGRQNWPINLRLPPYIPATFEGQHGRVQYWAKLLIERPWKGDIEYAKNFTVMGALDLNTDADAKKSVENSSDVMVGLICKSGPISGEIYVDKRGFVPGQNIPFRCKVENNSKKKLSARVVLSQKAFFRAEGQVRTQTVLVKGMTQGDIDPGEEIESEGEIKNIPPVAPSHLGGGCKNIDLKYFLTLICVASGTNKELDVPVELTIGTTPLRKMESTATSSSPKLKVKAAAKMASDSPRTSPRAPLARKI